MPRRALILVFGLAALACRIDNPAFGLERGSGAAEHESDDGDPSGPEESGESNEGHGDGDGDGDGDPDDSSSDGPNDTTDGDCSPGSSCGPCQICDQTGECVIDVGASCEGPQTHCGEYLYGSVEGACYKLHDVTLDGRCSEQGSCEPSPVSDCPYQQGAIHFACDPACVIDPPACTKYGKASEVEMASMCVVDGEQGPTCKTKCTNGVHGELEQYGCFEGECQAFGVVEICLGYLCNEQGTTCHGSCQSNTQCSPGFNCSDSQCLPG